MRLISGQPGPIPSPEKAENYSYTQREKAIVKANKSRTIAGDPGQVRNKLLKIAKTHAAEELVVVTITHSFKARLRSYELLANAFDL